MSIKVHAIHIASPTFLHAVSHLRIAHTKHPKSENLLNLVALKYEPVCDLQFGHVLDTSYITYVWLYTPHKELNVVRLDKKRCAWSILNKYVINRMCTELGVQHIQWEGFL